MIEIFNTKEKRALLIDESLDWVEFNPRHYEDKPYVIIELKGFDFFNHSYKCTDCKAFLEALNSDSVDWRIKYFDHVYRLNMKLSNAISNSATEIKHVVSDYQNGTILKLSFHEIPTDKEQLQQLLNESVEVENYEKASIIRDIIKGE